MHVLAFTTSQPYNINNRNNKSNNKQTLSRSTTRIYSQLDLEDIKVDSSFVDTIAPVSSSSSSESLTSFQNIIPTSSTSTDLVPNHLSDETKNNNDNNTVDQVGQNEWMNVILDKMGKVDESRITFEELRTGEVSRLYSNLKYLRDQDSGRIVSAVHIPGSTWSAAALVSGTMIGAGVLALPTATAPVGFIASTGGMVFAWVYMVLSGLLIAELAMNQMGRTTVGKYTTSSTTSGSLLSLYDSFLPDERLSRLAKGAYFFLHYAVMVAFLAQGGANFFSSSLSSSLSCPPGTGQVLFAGTVGGALYFGKKDTIERVNDGLVLAVFASLSSIIVVGAPHADFAEILAADRQHPELLADALPILFLSLVYHNVVPTVVAQLEGDRKKIITALISGTLAPLLLFIAWNAVILGIACNASNNNNVVDGAALLSGNIDPIALLLQQNGETNGASTSLLPTLIGVFSELAITTSIIGFVYGLMGELRTELGIPTQGPKYDKKWKPFLYAAVFLPPLFFSVSNPKIFYNALDYGGAFGVSTLFLVLPPIMVWSLRYGTDGDNSEPRPLTTLPMIPGGKLSLGSMWKVAGTLIVEQGAEKLGLIQWFQDNLHLAPTFM